ncbi:VirB4-like conjugal transfer ATPase, CD1110 family [Adlercreutzia sp. ZJ473]|uniref:VirB4-like conjugal transfer ATPase, CD1110 family n=1 Tax=Adlercreutzia sp. ZJ473 TaxID=2722822 RepID=UPI001555FDBB|nr:conjugal transfer protein TraE [Adlercreutzia sp. ZJ473]
MLLKKPRHAKTREQVRAEKKEGRRAKAARREAEREARKADRRAERRARRTGECITIPRGNADPQPAAPRGNAPSAIRQGVPRGAHGAAAGKPGPKNKAKQVEITAQDTLPFVAIAKDGIVMAGDSTYSETVFFTSIDYQLARREEREDIFDKWCDFLNHFDASVKVDITCINRKPHGAERTCAIVDKREDDGLDAFREEYSDMLALRNAQASGGLMKEHYVTLTIEAKDPFEARGRLSRIASDAISRLHAIGVHAHVLNGKERTKLIAEVCAGPNAQEAVFAPDHGRADIAKDAATPNEFDFGHGDWFRIDGAYKRAAYLIIDAPELSDKILADFLALECPITIDLHLEPLDQLAAKKMVKSKVSDIDKVKIEEQKKAIRAGYDPDILPPDLVTLSNDTRNLNHELENHNERLFKAAFVIVVEGATLQDLDNAFFAADAVAQQHNCKLKTLSYQQEAGFRSVVPVGSFSLHEKQLRILTTKAAAIFIPFVAAELSTGGDAIFYGVNTITRNLIEADRTKLSNPNGLILGIPGSGKSYSAKSEMAYARLYTDDDIIVGDPEGEYRPLIEGMKGQVVVVSSTSSDHINPMDVNLNYSDEDSPLAFKADFLLSLVELVMGSRDGLDPLERAAVDRCIRPTYQRYMDDPQPENMPVLGDLQEELYRQGTVEAKRIGDALEPYVHGSLSVFNHRTNVELSNRLVCFDTKELGKQLKKIGMLIVQDQVWNRVTVNRDRGRHTRYYMDEMHLMLREEQTAAYTVEIWKRFRKWGGIPTGITQNVKDLLSSREIENILDNSDFIMMLAQSAGDRAILADHLSISKQQLSYVTNTSPGEGLLFFGDIIVPFENRFDTDTQLYHLMTTKPGEAKVGRP